MAGELEPSPKSSVPIEDDWVRTIRTDILNAGSGQIVEPVSDNKERFQAQLHSTDDSVRQQAAKALASLSSLADPHAADLAVLLYQFNEEAQEASRALGRAGLAQNPGRAPALCPVEWHKVAEHPCHVVGVVESSWASVSGCRAGELGAAQIRQDAAGCRAAATAAIGALSKDAASAYASALIPLLEDRAWPVRRAAAQSLGEVGAAAGDVLNVLKACLTDAEPEVRAATATAIGKLGTRNQDLIHRASDCDEKTMGGEIVPELQEKEFATEIIAVLVPLIKDEALAPRCAAAWAIEHVALARQLDGSTAQSLSLDLAAILEDPNEVARAAGARALGALGPNAASHAASVAKLLKDSHWAVMAASAYALGRMGHSAASYCTEVVVLLDHLNEQVKQVAAQAVAEIGPDNVNQVEKVAALLEDPDADTQAVAAKALISIGLKSLAHLHADGSLKATEALGVLGEVGAAVTARAASVCNELSREDAWLIQPKGYNSMRSASSATEDFTKALFGSSLAAETPENSSQVAQLDEKFKLALLDAVAKIAKIRPLESQDLVRHISHLLTDQSPVVRKCAARALGGLGFAGFRYSAELLRAMEDTDIVVREEADVALKAIAESCAIKLYDRRWTARTEGARALACIGVAGYAHASSVAELLNDPHQDTRQAALEVLTSLGAAGSAHLDSIVARLEDPCWNVRQAACLALHAMGSAKTSYLKEVEVLLEDPCDPVRRTAATVLGVQERIVERILRSDVREMQTQASVELGAAWREVAPHLGRLQSQRQDLS